MSFATLSNTLDDFSAITSLNLTKNPFDSATTDGRIHLPALSASPSIFSQTNTPGSQKKKGFRWSIDQMSKLNPADIDEFPNQDYSSTCEKPEDEKKVQEAISEYFSHNTILPSPWTPDNHVKHVTFSPHPPSTTYISGDEDSMTDASQNSGTGYNTSGQGFFTDACCQTSLTFPPSFDLSKIVDSGFYSYVEEEGNSVTRDLNVSSLRRKLFSPDEQKSPLMSRERQPPRPRVTRSILKSPSCMNQLTSSPMKNGFTNIHSDSNSTSSNSASGRTSQSPAVSPIKAQAVTPEKYGSLNGMSGLKLDGTLSNDDVFCTDILESSDVNIDPQVIPDVSPIKPPEDDQDNLGDGGPMKVSELSHGSMEYENDEVNVSSVEMEAVEPLTSTHYTKDNDRPELSDLKEPNSSRAKFNDVIRDGVSTGDVKGDDVMDDHVDSKNHVCDDVMACGLRCGDDCNLMSKNSNDLMPEGCSRVQVDSWEYKKENMDLNQGTTMDGHGDEALVQRACAAMKRADRLVRETCMDESLTVSKRTGTSVAYLNVDKPLNHLNNYFNHVDKNSNHVDIPQNHAARAWYHVNKASSWHPIDMSTPLVSDKAKNKLQNVDTDSRRALLDTDSYNNLLSSFANSKLDQRSSLPDEENVFLSRDVTLDSRSMNRVPSQRHGARTNRSLSSIGNSGGSNLTQNFSSRYGYNNYGSVSKRFSWPPRQSLRSRHRYLTELSVSPRILSGLRRRSAEDRPRLRRSTSDDLKRISRRSQSGKREDYLNNYSRLDFKQNFCI